MNTIVVVCFFTGIIHMAESLTLSMRLAGVKTGQIASSISFVNVSFLIARMSNMLQAPLLGAMVDNAIRNGSGADLGLTFRYIIFSAFVGSFIGVFLTPTMVNVFVYSMRRFKKQGSIPKLLLQALLPRNIIKVVKCFRFPSFKMLKGIKYANIPHGFIYFNVAVSGIYAVGVLSSLWPALLPDLRATAVQLSGIVNGMATILLALVVDPAGAHIMDQAVRVKSKVNDVKTMIVFLLMGRLLATMVLAQLIFQPATNYIIYVTKIIGGTFGH